MLDGPLTLYELLNEQRKLQHALGSGKLTEADVPINILSAVSELTEALQETNWKPWKKTKHLVNRPRYAEELTDALQFWANAALAMGLTADDLASALRAKWVINRQRIRDGY